MSTSFPFLTLARDRGLDYGLVLTWADLEGLAFGPLSARLANSHAQLRAAAGLLSVDDKAAIGFAVRAEQERREAANGQ